VSQAVRSNKLEISRNTDPPTQPGEGARGACAETAALLPGTRAARSTGELLETASARFSDQGANPPRTPVPSGCQLQSVQLIALLLQILKENRNYFR